ncbi:MFS transporter [Streptomyces sp. NPDC007083]|uniref:MFS transporter n=1 Tax=Streptomyces sp. NPDC007083 TaxID=3156913 RepID=UPI0033FA3633
MNPAAARAGRQGRVLALLALAQLIIALDYNIVYMALPRIGTGLGFTPGGLQWVVSAYAVAFGGFLLLGGRACDLFGPRRMFVLGLVLYGSASLAGGLAGGQALLLAARAGQGVGGAFLFPATLTLVGTLFAEGRERNRAYSVWGAAGGSGLIVGALLGGLLTEILGWRAVFYVNVPLAAVALVAAYRLIAPDPTGAGRGGRLDVPGALTSTLGVTAVVLALVQGPESGWSAPPVPAAATLGAVLLAGFLLLQWRGRAPLMPLPLLRDRDLSTGVAVTFLFMGTIGSLVYFLTVYFQEVHGYGPLRTALAYLVPMVAVAAGSLLAGRVATRFGMRAAMVGGLAVAAAGAAAVGLTMAEDASYPATVPGLVVLGLGQGASYTLMFGAAAAGVDGRDVGVASGMASTTQQVGAAVGLALLVAVAAGSGVSRVDGLRHAVLLAALGTAVTALIALRFRRPRAAGAAASAPAGAEGAEGAAGSGAAVSAAASGIGAAGSDRAERARAEPAGG